MSAHALVCLIDGDRVLLSGDPLRLFDHDPGLQRLLQLLAELLLLAQLGRVDHVLVATSASTPATARGMQALI